MPLPLSLVVRRQASSMIRGSGNLKAGAASVGPVSPVQGYLASARGLLPGVQALGQTATGVAGARALVAAHVLECILKAYLSHRGVTENDLKDPKRRHNLELLWQEAAGRGLGIDVVPASWCVRLNELHNTPYHLRYPRVHALVLPAAEPMTSELESIVGLVSAMAK